MEGYLWSFQRGFLDICRVMRRLSWSEHSYLSCHGANVCGATRQCKQREVLFLMLDMPVC